MTQSSKLWKLQPHIECVCCLHSVLYSPLQYTDSRYKYNMQTVNPIFIYRRFYWKIWCAKLHFLCMSVNTSTQHCMVEIHSIESFKEVTSHVDGSGVKSSFTVETYGYLLYFHIYRIHIFVCFMHTTCIRYVRYSYIHKCVWPLFVHIQCIIIPENYNIRVYIRIRKIYFAKIYRCTHQKSSGF